MKCAFRDIGEPFEMDDEELDAVSIDAVLVVRCDLTRFKGRPDALERFAKGILHAFEPRFEHVIVVPTDVEFLTLEPLPEGLDNEGFRD